MKKALKKIKRVIAAIKKSPNARRAIIGAIVGVIVGTVSVQLEKRSYKKGYIAGCADNVVLFASGIGIFLDKNQVRDVCKSLSEEAKSAN